MGWTWYLLALCMWREAASEGAAGMRGVGWVIRNRAWSHGPRVGSMARVILAPFQFSSMTAPGDRGLVRWPEEGDDAFELALAEAMRVMGESEDPTGGATFFYSFPLTGPPSSWGAVVQTVRVGKLTFYKPA